MSLTKDLIYDIIKMVDGTLYFSIMYSQICNENAPRLIFFKNYFNSDTSDCDTYAIS